MKALAVIPAVVRVGIIGTAVGLSQPAHPQVTRGEYERWQTELSNWGRWGPTD